MRQLPCFFERSRLRTDSRVTVSRKATASAIRPAAWAESPGLPIGIAEVSEIGSAFRPAVVLPPGSGPGLGVAAGLISGNNCAALPAPTSELLDPVMSKPAPFRLG